MNPSRMRKTKRAATAISPESKQLAPRARQHRDNIAQVARFSVGMAHSDKAFGGSKRVRPATSRVDRANKVAQQPANYIFLGSSEMLSRCSARAGASFGANSI